MTAHRIELVVYSVDRVEHGVVEGRAVGSARTRVTRYITRYVWEKNILSQDDRRDKDVHAPRIPSRGDCDSASCPPSDEIEDEGPGVLCEVENVEWMVEDRISMRTLCSVGIGFRPILLWYKRLMLVVEGL